MSPATPTRARRLIGFAVFAALLGTAPAASAHLVTTNLGPFYDGFAHFFTAPETLLPVLALALLAGLRGPAFGRALLLCLPVAWLAGACGSVWLAPRAALPLGTAGVTLAFGALVAADVALPRLCVAGFAGGLGLFAGALSGADLARASAPLTLAMGTTCALFITTALIAGRVTSLRAPWTRIAVRVAGSWIAASGLLMLGWALR
jgi:hydrogenase/urease accessory protein HupE